MNEVNSKCKKITESLLLAYFLIVITIRSNAFIVDAAEPKIIHVPLSYSSIQEAINEAENGDTVLVAQGIYYENLIVNKSISLIAENQNVIINSTIGNVGSVVQVTAKNASIIGFTIRGGAAGVFLHGSKNLEVFTVVKGNTIMDAKYGVYVYWSNGSLVTENTMVNNTIGIYVYWSSACIKRNMIENNSNGTVVVGSRSSTFSRNTFRNNGCGIYIDWTQAAHKIYYNNFINNTQNAYFYGGSESVWDDGYPCGGNYWSDYNHTDLLRGPYQNVNGSDGIGDIPYQIDENNIDQFPLMGKFYTFIEYKEGNEIEVFLISNSTVSDFTYLTYSDSQNGQTISLIRFNVTGEHGSVGFCRITIPHDLLQGPYRVTVNDLPPLVENEIATNITHTCLYFTYYHCTEQVIIIPELSAALLLLFILFSVFIKLVKTGRFKKIL